MGRLQKWPIPVEWEEPIDRWILRLRAAGRSEETIRTRLQHIRTAARGLGDSPFQITEDQLLEWVVSKPWRPETRNAYYSSIRAFFEWVALAYNVPNPAALLSSIRRRIPPSRPVPDEVLRAALLQASPRDALILRLAAFAGLRCAEIAQCNVSDLQADILGYSLLVHGKGGVERLVPLNNDLVEDIKAHGASNPEGWILPSKYGGHLSPQRVSTIGRKILPGSYSLHQLRHRYGTTAYAHSGDIVAVQALLGHQSISTTQRYVQRPQQAIRKAATFAQSLHLRDENSDPT
ncbi:tyrosine-type recombinase/integrase [Trueperella pyogenes]